jgi:hypothetical protein
VNRLFILPLLATSLYAAEITTGFMLGKHYDPRAFYVRNGPADIWQKTYSGPAYRHEAQGKLMNVRLANALFLDEWMHERVFDPEFNTDAVIQALDTTSPSTASIVRQPIAWARVGGPT